MRLFRRRKRDRKKRFTKDTLIGYWWYRFILSLRRKCGRLSPRQRKHLVFGMMGVYVLLFAGSTIYSFFYCKHEVVTRSYRSLSLPDPITSPDKSKELIDSRMDSLKRLLEERLAQEAGVENLLAIQSDTSELNSTKE